MRALVQRSKASSVSVAGEVIGRIDSGLVILLGVTHLDGAKEAEFLARKCANLRIFEDQSGKMNLSLLDVGGEALVVSQFTLYGDASEGRRPSFTAAAEPRLADSLYREFIVQLQKLNIRVAEGRFGADMMLQIANDGPVTLMVESK